MKNVIFDLGGVLLNWNPLSLCEAAGADTEQTKALMDSLLLHSDWVNLDRGLLDRNSLLEAAQDRTALSLSFLHNVMDRIPDVLTHMPDSIRLLEELRWKDIPCYVLSNMSRETARYLEAEIDFLNLFSGIIFSCDVGMAKPDAAIWSLTLNHFGLAPGDTLFIDDSLPNIAAAESAGISSILFTDAASLREELVARGLLA